MSSRKDSVLEAARQEARNHVAARDRAHWRSPAPNGGDPFMENIETAARHLKQLRKLVGAREAARMVQEIEAQKPRIVYEATPQTRTPKR